MLSDTTKYYLHDRKLEADCNPKVVRRRRKKYKGEEEEKDTKEETK